MLEFIAGVLASPFWQVVLTTVATALAADYAAFKKFESFQQFAAYSWGLAAWRGFQGLVIGIGSGLSLPLIAEAIRKLAVLLLVVAVGASAACGARPTRDGQRIAPEAEAALQLERGIDALDALSIPPGNSPIDRLVAAKVVTVDEALAVAKGVKTALGTAEQVALGLKASLAARTEAEKQVGLNRASVLLRALGDQLASVPITIGTEKGRRAVVDLLRLASSLLLTAGSIFPAPAPEGPPPSLAPIFEDGLAFAF